MIHDQPADPWGYIDKRQSPRGPEQRAAADSCSSFEVGAVCHGSPGPNEKTVVVTRSVLENEYTISEIADLEILRMVVVVVV